MAEFTELQNSIEQLKKEFNVIQERIKTIKQNRKDYHTELDQKNSMLTKEQEAIKQILILAQQESIEVQLEKNEATREREKLEKLNKKDTIAFKAAVEKEKNIKEKEEAIWKNMKDMGERMGKIAEKILTIYDKMAELDNKMDEKIKPLETESDKIHFEMESKQQEINRMMKNIKAS